MRSIEAWNIIWSGCIPGALKEDDYGVYRERNCYRGVKEFDEHESAGSVANWIDEASVHYGEEGGSFKVHGAFRGTYDDLKKGETRFIREREIYELAEGEAHEAEWEAKMEKGIADWEKIK